MILVTGATGNVGREVVKALAERGVSVRAATRRPGAAPQNPGVTEVAFEYGDRESVRKALSGVEKVFVVAPFPAQEELVVKEAAAAGVARLVKLSVWKAHEEAFIFGRWHRAAERLVEESGVPHTFLRPGGYMQNFVTFMLPTIREQGAFYLPAGDARIAHIHVGDIGRAAAVVLLEDGHVGKAYDLSGPAAFTYSEAAATLSDVVGKPVRYVDPGEGAARNGMIAAGTPPEYADAFIDLNRYYKSGAMSTPSPWVRTLTGREPVSFRAFAEENAAAFK